MDYHDEFQKLVGSVLIAGSVGFLFSLFCSLFSSRFVEGHYVNYWVTGKCRVP